MPTITENRMTNDKVIPKNTIQKLLGTWLLIAAIAYQPTAHASKENKMIQLNLSVWQLIENLQDAPLSLDRVEKLLAQSLIEEIQHSNEHFRFFAGKPLALAGNSTIVGIDLRLPRSSTGKPGLLALNLGGECISLKNLQTVFSNLKVTGMPRGGSLEEATTYTEETAWGEISFGFQEKKPECLGYVVFEPNKGTH